MFIFQQTYTAISIVVPVYLGENSIEELIRRLTLVLQGITDSYEFVLINDASTDGSWQVIEKLAQADPHVQAICLAENIGQHAAISVGLLHAKGRYVAIMDCDMQDVPEEFPKLWNKAMEGYDIVMARRTQRKDNRRGQVMSWLFHQILSLKRGVKTDPSISNYALYSHKVINQYRSNYRNKPETFFFGMNYLEGHSISCVDTVHGASARGYSSYTFTKQFALALTLLFLQRKAVDGIPFFKIRTSFFVHKGYGIALRRLSAEKAETVREWRNLPSVSRHMRYKGYITPEMQQKWFESINNEHNLYTIIEYEKEEIGLSNMKDIDYIHQTAEAGIFIFNENFLDSDISIRVSLCGLDYCFEILRMEVIKVNILRENIQAIRFNQALGYKLHSSTDETAQLYTLTRSDYYKQRQRLIDLLADYEEHE